MGVSLRIVSRDPRAQDKRLRAFSGSSRRRTAPDRQPDGRNLESKKTDVGEEGKRRKMRPIISALVAILTTSAHADTFNYVCKDHGKSLPLRVDDKLNTLVWKGTTYSIKENENCAKFGWHAEKDGDSFDFCTATQDYAGIQQNGIEIPCNLKRR
jgi:hypothetical protein